MQRWYWPIGILFSVAGLAICTLAASLLIETLHFRTNALSTAGIVTQLQQSTTGRPGNSSTDYATVVEFYDRSHRLHTYTSSTGSSPPSYAVGQRVSIMYDPANPSSARIDNFGDMWLSSVLLGSLGLPIVTVGSGLVLVAWRRQRVIRWLRQHGQHITATITGVQHNQSIEINGRFPYQVTCQWQNPANGQSYAFASDNFRNDPSPYIPQKTIQVVIDPNNPKRYYVDTSFLPTNIS